MRTLLVVDPWADFVARVSRLGSGAETVALSLAIALVVAVLGWAVASLVSHLTALVLRAVRFNEWIRGIVGTHRSPAHEPTRLVAVAIYWIIFGFAILLALETLGVSLLTSVGQRLGSVVPLIVAAAVLFAVGTIVAIMIGGLTHRFLESAELRTARLWGQVVAGVLTGFAALLALEQLGFAAQFVMILGGIGAACVGLGLALAFGLGCRDLARDFVVEYLRSLDRDEPPRP